MSGCFFFVSASQAAPSRGELREVQRQQEQIIQQQEDLRRRQEEEFRQRQDAAPSSVPVPRLPHESVDPKASCMEVKGIAVGGATLLRSSSLRSLVAPYENRCLSIGEITNLLRDITNAYIDRGYVTARAFVDPSQEAKGTLRILVIEGKVESIILNDGDKNSVYRGKTAFPGLVGKPLNLRDVEQGIDQLNRLPSGNASMELVPGETVGGTIIKVNNPVARSWRVGAGMDNLGQRSTGQMQYNLSFEKDNLMGVGDQFAVYWSADAPPLDSAVYGHKPTGHNRSFSTYFSLPWGYWTLSGNLSRSAYDSTIFGANSNYTTNGDTSTHSIQIERVVHRDADGKTSLSASLNNRGVDSFIQGVHLESSSYDLNTLGVSASHSRKMLGGVASLNLAYTRGLSALGTKKQEYFEHGVPKSEFDKYAATLTWYRPFTVEEQRLYWNLTAQGQTSPETLYGPERIQIGGRSSVRGFQEDSITGDQGVYVRNEAGWNLPWWESLTQSGPVRGLQAYVAYDYGFIQPDSRDPYERGQMQGAAIGLRTQGSLSVDCTLAKPLEHPSFVKARDTEFYTSVKYTF